MSKKLIKISIFIIILGITLSIIGLVGFKGDLEVVAQLYNQDYLYESKDFSSTNNFEDISIDVLNRNLIFEQNDDNELKIIYFDSEDDFLKTSENGSSLIITNDAKLKIQRFPRWESIDIRDVIISLPSNFSGNITTKSLNGSIKFEDINILKAIKVSTTNGNLDLIQIDKLDSIDFHTTNGYARVIDATIDDIKLSNVNGFHFVSDVIAKIIDITTTNGNIEVILNGNPSEYKVSTQTVNGKMYFNGKEVQNGTIQPTGIYEIKTETVNGKIKITIN